ncbi:MAG: hypothetical protein K8R54_15015 [Bacteroidales bacterium]|nr:hypothetical protein [Bacteroidales bacterium]
MKRFLPIVLIFISLAVFGQQNKNVEVYLNKILENEIENGWLKRNAIIEIKGFAVGDTVKLHKIFKVLEIQDIKKIWSIDPGNSRIINGKKGQYGTLRVICTKTGKKKLKKLKL